MPEGGRRRVKRSSSELDLEQDFSLRLKRAREQLSILREQEEQLDRERKELEGLKMQTEELDLDKRKIAAKLDNAVDILLEEEEETKKRQQEIVDIRKEFEGLVKEIEFAEKKGQKTENIPRKIVIEREVVEKAKEVFDKASKRLDILREGELVKDEDEFEVLSPSIGMVDGLKVGVGFFLAGAMVGAVAYVLFLLFR